MPPDPQSIPPLFFFAGYFPPRPRATFFLYEIFFLVGFFFFLPKPPRLKHGLLEMTGPSLGAHIVPSSQMFFRTCANWRYRLFFSPHCLLFFDTKGGKAPEDPSFVWPPSPPPRNFPPFDRPCFSALTDLGPPLTPVQEALLGGAALLTEPPPLLLQSRFFLQIDGLLLGLRIRSFPLRVMAPPRSSL